MDTQMLLVQYARSRSDRAFGELVSRYVNLVYSSALRVVDGDRHMAEDVTQQVFADLAAKAGSLGSEVMLGGWLHRKACFVARSRMRRERRRVLREHRFAEITSMIDHSEANLAGLKAVLDEAIDELRVEDRVPILLRFFEQRDYRAIAEAIGTTEEAAQKRVSRALEKLSILLTRRGFAATSALLATFLAEEATAAAPAGFAAIVAASPTAAAQGLPLLKLLGVGNLKLAFGIAAVIGVAAVPAALQHRAAAKLAEENRGLREQVAELSRIGTGNQRPSDHFAQTPPVEPADTGKPNELLRLRGEVGRLIRDKEEWEQEKRRLVAKVTAGALLSSDSNTPTPPMIFRKTLKVDPQALFETIRQTFPEQDLGSTNACLQAFRWMLQTNKIELQAPESVFLNDRTGDLIVAASMTNLNAIESLVVRMSPGL